MTLFQDAQKYLPAYLTSAEQYKIFQNLRNAYPDINYYSSDYIALLDDTHSLPTDYYLKNKEKKAYIKLSNEGFYVFILKLTIHFCRLFDGFDRG